MNSVKQERVLQRTCERSTYQSRIGHKRPIDNNYALHQDMFLII